MDQALALARPPSAAKWFGRRATARSVRPASIERVMMNTVIFIFIITVPLALNIIL